MRRLILLWSFFVFDGFAVGELNLFAAEPWRDQQEITATFSIVAVDPESGVVGAAVASKYPAVGKVVPYVRAGVGGFCTQKPPLRNMQIDVLFGPELLQVA